MANNPPIRVLSVYLGDREVGALTHLPGENTIFTFSESYARDNDRPTLSLSYKTPTGNVRAPTRATHQKIPPFFSNLLPEGNLREYLAEKGGVHPTREFFLIWLLGQDLAGSVITRPADDASMPPEATTGMPRDEESPDLLRFSLAGVQLKFSAIMESTGGLTIPAHGTGGSWIVKLPSSLHASVPDNEYAMLMLAREVGIDAAEAKLTDVRNIGGLPTDLPLSGQALAVKRFDREYGRRIHIEDFAQVFAEFPGKKYKNASYQDLARVLVAETNEASMADFVRRLAFNALIGNADMHLKNWSLIYRDGRRPELSPAYDFVSTVPYLPDKEMALSIAGTKSFSDVSVDLFRRFAAKTGLPEELVVETVRQTSIRLLDAWNKGDHLGGLPKELRTKIESHMKTVPLSKL